MMLEDTTRQLKRDHLSSSFEQLGHTQKSIKRKDRMRKFQRLQTLSKEGGHFVMRMWMRFRAGGNVDIDDDNIPVPDNCTKEVKKIVMAYFEVSLGIKVCVFY